MAKDKAQDNFDEMLAELKEYVRITGSASFCKDRSIDPQSAKMFYFVDDKRRKCKHGKLPDEQYRKLLQVDHMRERVLAWKSGGEQTEGGGEASAEVADPAPDAPPTALATEAEATQAPAEETQDKESAAKEAQDTGAHNQQPEDVEPAGPGGEDAEGQPPQVKSETGGDMDPGCTSPPAAVPTDTTAEREERRPIRRRNTGDGESVAMSEVEHNALCDPFLPSDAPEGHEAHRSAKYVWSNGRPICKFSFHRDGEVINVQTTMLKCRGSRYACERLARAMYVFLEAGAEREQAFALRDETYEKLKEVPVRPIGDKPPQAEDGEDKPRRGRKPKVVKSELQEEEARAAGQKHAISKAETPDEKDASENIEKKQNHDGLEVKSEPELKKEEIKTEPADGDVGNDGETVSVKKESIPGAQTDAGPAPGPLPSEAPHTLGAAEGERYYRCPGCRGQHRAHRFDKTCQYKDETELPVNGNHKAKKRKKDKKESKQEAGNAWNAFLGDDMMKEEGAPLDNEKGKPTQEAQDATQAGVKEEAKTEVKQEPKHENEEFEDAPPGHQAWTKVKWEESTRAAKFRNKGSDGSAVLIQTTLKACGMSQYHCERICRLLMVKHMDGATKEQVLEYRGQLYKELEERLHGAASAEGNAGVEPPRKKSRRGKLGEDGASAAPGGKEQTAVKGEAASATAKLEQRLRASGRLKGAVRLAGRHKSKKNASMNGVYALLADGCDGAPAYERVGDVGNDDADASLVRFLFYSANKKRWKVSDVLGDPRGGFAYAKSSNSKRPPLFGEDAKNGDKPVWCFFDGKAEGYNEDPAVRCTLFGPATETAAGAVDGVKREPLKEPTASDVAAASTADVSENAESGGSDSEDSSRSGSGSSSSSSGDSDDDDAKAPEKAKAQTPAAKVPAADASTAQAATANAMGDAPGENVSLEAAKQAAAKAVANARGKVCGKMLARSGFRCVCHFAIECPRRAVTAS